MNKKNILIILFYVLLIIWAGIARARKDFFSLSILSVFAGVFLLISSRQMFYDGIVTQKVANRTYLGHRPGTPLFIIGKPALVRGIIGLLFCLSLIIIPLYFIIGHITFMSWNGLFGNLLFLAGGAFLICYSFLPYDKTASQLIGKNHEQNAVALKKEKFLRIIYLALGIIILIVGLIGINFKIIFG